MTVLVVDDEPNIRGLLASSLEDAGFSVVTAGDGLDALALSRSGLQPVDVLVTDVAMPGMDGPTLARELLADQPDLPVILMSGACELAALAQVDSAQFLAKPFSMAALLTLVRTVAGDRVAQSRRQS